MKLELSKWYKILAPRPVILVSTVNKKGVSNAAPFSFAMPVSIDPPLVAFASDPEHDTVKNINQIPEFVVNIPAKEILSKLWICRKNFPYGVSEIKESGLTEEKSSRVKPPRIQECLAKFECRLYQKWETGDHLLIVGEVLEAVMDKRFFKHGKYDLKSAAPLLHIGGEEFVVPQEIIYAE